MTLWRGLAVLGFLFSAAATSAGAQTSPVALASGNFIDAYGLTVTIGSYTCSLGCGTGDQLVVVPTGRGTITFEVVNSTSGSHIFSAASGSSRTMTLVLNITPNSTYVPTGSNVSGAILTTTGLENFSSSGGTAPTAKASAVFSSGASATTLTDTMAVKTSSGTLQTIASTANTFLANSNNFTVTETLTLNPQSRTVSNLSFDSIALQLKTVPEPATISVLMIGFGGLVMARRRQQPR
jgi:hypothetical protein